MRSSRLLPAFILATVTFAAPLPRLHAQHTAIAPGTRTVMDAHNCYPYFEWWYDRIDRALSTGTPVAIEQDLGWYTDKKTGKSWSVVTHGQPFTGEEPVMEHYFFDRVRPIVEQALKDNNRSQWPLITLNLDFKTEEPEHLEAVWALLDKYRDWLTTAPKTGSPADLPALDVRPILVLTGESDAQQAIFYDKVPVGQRLLLFGAVHTHMQNPMAAPAVLEPEHAGNYRRWWNNPWKVVEEGGQNKAGDWTKSDEMRLRSLVDHAHANGLWIRFYTLDGSNEKERSANGWFHGYDFGTLAAAEVRWKAAQQDGVDYLASDQYERAAHLLRTLQASK
jgi:hypothetical protein